MLKISDLRTKAIDTARGGARASAAGITYAQAAERAVELAGSEDLDQIARWWVREKLDAGAFFASEWSGQPEDLPLELGPEDAALVVEFAVSIWRDVVLEAIREVESQSFSATMGTVDESEG